MGGDFNPSELLMGDTKQEEEEEAFSAYALAYLTLRILRMGE